jgi:hypothetical protein
MSTSSDDLAILLNECIRQRKELRESNDNLRAIAIKSDADNTELCELNAELLAALRNCRWCAVQLMEPDIVEQAERAIAKAEEKK